uniref:Nucleolin n=1 Tax=Saimiri boliviensis boliviensis TaxID=39432 RepID=A0A2K6SYW9_SAIBB
MRKPRQEKNQGDLKKMAPPPKEVEDSEDEEMSEDVEGDSSGEEVVIPQKNSQKAAATLPKKVVVSSTKKVAVATPAKKALVIPGKKAAATPVKKMAAPAKAVATPGKKRTTPGKALVATPGKKSVAIPAEGAKNGKNAKKEDSDEEEEEDSEEEEEDEDEFEPTVGKAAVAVPASEDEDDEDDDDDEDDEDDEDGIAYIEFKTEADAEKTFDEKQGMEINGGGKNSTCSVESKNQALSNLSYSATEETLLEALEKATFIKAPQNHTGKSKWYAFIEFASFEDAKEALNSRNKREIEGPGGSPNARSQPSKTLFVNGLSEDTTEETLKESFDDSDLARIVTDWESGSSKGFGFVNFNSEEDAKAAKEAMEDGEIEGNKVTLDCAKSKGEGGFGGHHGGRGGFEDERPGRLGGFGGGGGGDHKPQGKKMKFE